MSLSINICDSLTLKFHIYYREQETNLLNFCKIGKDVSQGSSEKEKVTKLDYLYRIIFDGFFLSQSSIKSLIKCSCYPLTHANKENC